MLSKHVSIFSWHCRIDASKIVKVFEIAVRSAAGGVFAHHQAQECATGATAFHKTFGEVRASNYHRAALGMCRFSFVVFFVLTCFRYSCYRIDEAVGAEKRLLHRAI